MAIRRLDPKDEEERNSRTVFAYSISLTASEEEIVAFFNTAAKVKSIDLLKDKEGNSEGKAYVEFEDQAGRESAISALNETKFQDQTIYVQATQSML